MHVVRHLDEARPEGVENEAVEQVAFADRILVSAAGGSGGAGVGAGNVPVQDWGWECACP